MSTLTAMLLANLTYGVTIVGRCDQCAASLTNSLNFTEVLCFPLPSHILDIDLSEETETSCTCVYENCYIAGMKKKCLER